MNFQRTTFFKKWEKSLCASTTVYMNRTSLSDDENKMILAFKNPKTKSYSRYMTRIAEWCHNNNIDYDFIDIIPHDDDQDQTICHALHLKFEL